MSRECLATGKGVNGPYNSVNAEQEDLSTEDGGGGGRRACVLDSNAFEPRPRAPRSIHLLPRPLPLILVLARTGGRDDSQSRGVVLLVIA